MGNKNGLTRGKFLKLAGWGSLGVIATVIIRSLWLNRSPKIRRRPRLVEPSPDSSPISSPISSPSPSPSAPPIKKKNYTLRTFTFGVITVNSQGKTISRRQKQGKYFIADLGNKITLEMVSIPGGKFLMGSPENEEGRTKDESPQHQVTVSPFFMGKYPITQAQWQAVMKNNPSYFKGAARPVENVSWEECVVFCGKLSQIIGRECRMPSEAEWEYAARAGTTTPFHFGETLTTALANYDGEYTYGSGVTGVSRKQTTSVGSFPPNAFGLYDIHGQVWEWCADTWHENYDGAPTDGTAWEVGSSSQKLIRGGCWAIYPRNCRSAIRLSSGTLDKNKVSGFRVACF